MNWFIYIEGMGILDEFIFNLFLKNQYEFIESIRFLKDILLISKFIPSKQFL